MEDAVYAIDPALSLRVYITQNLHEKVLKVQDSSRRFQSMLKKVNFTANYVSLQKWAFDVNEELAVQFIHSLTEKEDVLIESLDEIVNFFLEHGLTDRCKKLLEIASKFTYNRYILENIAAMQETVYSPLRVTNTTIFLNIPNVYGCPATPSILHFSTSSSVIFNQPSFRMQQR